MKAKINTEKWKHKYETLVSRERTQESNENQETCSWTVIESTKRGFLSKTASCITIGNNEEGFSSENEMLTDAVFIPGVLIDRPKSVDSALFDEDSFCSSSLELGINEKIAQLEKQAKMPPDSIDEYFWARSRPIEFIEHEGDLVPHIPDQEFDHMLTESDLECEWNNGNVSQDPDIIGAYFRRSHL